jgi:argininosuccinate lyase
MMHVSRLCEEMVLWSSTEFGMIQIDEGYATGSSIMPQKRNPDIAELARGKTGRVYGSLLSILTIMKGLPLTYNRDMQEDKEGLFDTVDTLSATLKVISGMVRTLTINAPRVLRMAEDDYQLATDVADYLAAKGIPFREAHEITGRLTRYAIEHGRHFSQLKLSEYRAFSKAFSKDVKLITVETSVSARDVPGATAPQRVAQAIKAATKELRTV